MFLCGSHTTSITRISLLCFQKRWNCLYLTNSVTPEPEGSSPYSQEPATGPYPEPSGSNLHFCPFPTPLYILRKQTMFYGGPPTVGCPRLLIQYIRSYPPYLEAVSSIRNPRTRHVVVTVDPLNMGLTIHRALYYVLASNLSHLHTAVQGFF
jgi:hypothetical protein